MNLLVRTRSLTRSILIWLLLLVYAGAPMAVAVQPQSHWVSVPFCSVQEHGAGSTHQHRHVVLRFDSRIQASGNTVWTLPPSSPQRIPAPRVSPEAVANAGASPITANLHAWRPPPRASPVSIANL